MSCPPAGRADVLQPSKAIRVRGWWELTQGGGPGGLVPRLTPLSSGHPQTSQGTRRSHPTPLHAPPLRDLVTPNLYREKPARGSGGESAAEVGGQGPRLGGVGVLLGTKMGGGESQGSSGGTHGRRSQRVPGRVPGDWTPGWDGHRPCLDMGSQHVGSVPDSQTGFGTISAGLLLPPQKSSVCLPSREKTRFPHYLTGGFCSDRETPGEVPMLADLKCGGAGQEIQGTVQGAQFRVG